MTQLGHIEDGKKVNNILQTVPAAIDASVKVTLLEQVKLTGSRQSSLMSLARLSEPSLSDWNRHEEEEAWSHLQSGT